MKTSKSRVVLFIPSYARFGGCVNAGLLLSQLHFWQTTMQAWFYKTQKQLECETGLTRTQLETARRRLVEGNLIEHRHFGIPRRSHYKVNISRVVELWCNDTGLSPDAHPHHGKSTHWKKGKLNISSQKTCTPSTKELEVEIKYESVTEKLVTPSGKYKPQTKNKIEDTDQALKYQMEEEQPATLEQITAVMAHFASSKKSAVEVGSYPSNSDGEVPPLPVLPAYEETVACGATG